ncbi:stage II sporulation protein M [Clostridium sp.]|uniref:stage II sporulation protein M n=1 Tax=Clostridium sp. TaxID=1506 RepID=UPI003463D9A6
MDDKNFFLSIRKYINYNKWFYLGALLFLLTGIVIGIYVVLYMGDTYKSDITEYFISFTKDFSSMNVNNKLILFESIKNNGLLIIAIFIMGIIIVGIPIILIINLIKGFTIGFSAGLIMNSMGLKGGLFVLLGVIPQNIFYIGALLFISVFSADMALNKLRNKFVKTSYPSKDNYKYIYILVMSFSMILLGAVIESYITPYIIKYII